MKHESPKGTARHRRAHRGALTAARGSSGAVMRRRPAHSIHGDAEGPLEGKGA